MKILKGMKMNFNIIDRKCVDDIINAEKDVPIGDDILKEIIDDAKLDNPNYKIVLSKIVEHM